MQKISHIQINDYLEQNFPEFVASVEYDSEEKETPYVFFGSFNRLVQKWLQDKNEAMVERFFKFVNDFYAQPEIDSDAENLFAVELFEPFLSEQYYSIFNLKLNGKAKQEYLKMYNWKPAKNIEINMKGV